MLKPTIESTELKNEISKLSKQIIQRIFLFQIVSSQLTINLQEINKIYFRQKRTSLEKQRILQGIYFPLFHGFANC